jgi:hypothetical protein
MKSSRDLDTRRSPRLNLRVRALAAFCLVLASATTAWAKPRVQVAPFTVKGEALGYFGPEVARAMVATLEGDGVETGAGAAETLTGNVEELAGDKVRLTATLRGKTLSAEGPLEAIDAVATSLANKLAPLLLENDPAAQKLAEKRARDAEKRAASVPPSRPAPKPAVARSKPGPAPAPPETEAKEEAKPAVVEEPKVAEPAKAEAKPEAKPDTRSDVKPESKPEAKEEAPKQPDWVPPRVDTPPPRTPTPPAVTAPPAPPTPSPYFGGFVRGRVVAHAIAEPPSTYATAGVMATQALFSFLHRRLRLTVIPTGVGITSANVAADEAYRAAARAVVMARLESVEFLPGPAARVRLEVVVVRDGRPVMRRIVESAPTAPSDPSRRVATSDPVYQAVTMALEALVPELVGALADVR